MKCLLIAVVLLLAVSCNIEAALRQRGTGTLVGVQNEFTQPPSIRDYLTQKQQHAKDPYIVGGEVAEDAYAPWQVSIQNYLGNHFCGGAIIADKYVLTAASCVAGLNKQRIKVVTSTNEWWGLAWQYAIEEILIHCNFDKPLYHNDIALLKLQTFIAYDEKTQKIDIAEEDDLVDGEPLTMTGWGSWEIGGLFEPDLKKLGVSYMPYEKCKLAYDNSTDVDIGHLCTMASKGEGACHGDTGGPLVDSKGRLVGIGNWGIPCAYGFPDVFAKLSFYTEWIRTTINGCSINP